MRRRASLGCLLLVGGLACGGGPDGAVDPGDEDGEDAADTRGPLGKADENGLCGSVDVCGAQSNDGCWCDDQCEGFGDCCSDYADVCLDAGASSTTAPEPEPQDTSDGSSGAPEPEPACAKNVVVMGYWPPTNEMLRPWSTNPDQNREAWQGENWRGLGYDVHAFFPEFPPDGDPTNDEIGDPGAVGSPDFDLQVDYQATSEDFWRIVDDLRPIVLITTSRGGSIGWEIEGIEGGHGDQGEPDPAQDWRSDGFGDVTRPTQATINPRSWDAIEQFRLGVTVESALPMQAIADATSMLDIASVEIDGTGTSGNFLSGFLGLHGIVYHQSHAHNVAAGHIHVGIGMPTETARALIESTLEVVLQTHPAADAACP